MYLGRLVLAGGDEVGSVLGPLEIRDGRIKLVNGLVVDQVTILVDGQLHVSLMISF